MNGYFSIGNIIKVESSSVTILVKDFTHLERIHYNGTIYKGISVGTFVGVIRGSDKIVVQIIKESINNIEESFDGSTLLKNKVQRKLVAKIIGVIRNKEYETGIKTFPLMFDDVVLLNEDELKIVFYLPQKENKNVLDIGKMSSHDELRVKIPINDFLDTHIGVFGNTGSGKSNTVAKLYATLFDKIDEEFKSKNINSTFVFVDFHNEYKEYFSKYEKNEKIKIKIKTISPSDEDFKISTLAFWNYETLIRSFSDFSQEEKEFIKEIINLKKEKFDLNIYYNFIKNINEDNLELDSMQLEKIWEKYKNYKEKDLKTLLYIDSLSKMREFDTGSKGGKLNYSFLKLTLKKNERYLLKMFNVFGWGKTFKDYIEKLNIHYEREWLLFWTYELAKRFDGFHSTKRYLLDDIYDIWKKLSDNTLKFNLQPYVSCLELRRNYKKRFNCENRFSSFYIWKDEIPKLEEIKVYLAIAELSLRRLDDINKNIFDKIKKKLLDLIPKNISYIPHQIEIHGAQIMILSLKDEDVELQKTWPIVVANELFNSQKLLDSNGIKRSVHFIIDEAHNLISSKLSEETKDENINRLSLFEKFIREGRKFNFFLTISTQEPWSLDSGITSQLSNFFIHRFVNGNDLENVNKYIANLNDILYNKIPILNPGQCVLWGSKFKTPLMIQVDKLGKETKNKSLEELWGLKK